MNYREKIEELLENATPAQITEIARQAMVSAMSKALNRRLYRIDMSRSEDRKRLASAVKAHWDKMINGKSTKDWRDELTFNEGERI